MEVINYLTDNFDDITIYIRTTSPRWIFDFTLRGSFNYEHVFIDVGIVQESCFFSDKRKTLEKVKLLLSSKKKIIEEEANFVSGHKIDIIVGDIPPLAFKIARAAGIPCAGIANFSWDWIYSEYAAEYNEFIPLIEEIKEYYSLADILYRLPFHGDLTAFKNIKDIPLIARKSKTAPETIIKKAILTL